LTTSRSRVSIETMSRQIETPNLTQYLFIVVQAEVVILLQVSLHGLLGEGDRLAADEAGVGDVLHRGREGGPVGGWTELKSKVNVLMCKMC
jgi:hypothetical protein